jgi:DNA-binding HxlR family transcriptional regulator
VLGDIDVARCSIARATEVLGDRWTVLILRDLFNGIRRFDELAAHLGVARNVLTRRLAGLVDAGVVVRVPYREPGRRERHEYRLTAAGRDLRPVLLALVAWGDAHRPDPQGPPLRFEHDGCGGRVGLEMRCSHGHVVPPRELLSVPLP